MNTCCCLRLWGMKEEKMNEIFAQSPISPSSSRSLSTLEEEDFPDVESRVNYLIDRLRVERQYAKSLEKVIARNEPKCRLCTLVNH